jgi:eukaryotic-like serine/threonine-protein kinase
VGRRLLRALGVLAYVGLVLVVFTMSAYVAFNVFVRSGVTRVPDLKGLSEEEARGRLSDQGLEGRHRPEDDRFDGVLEAGRVVTQRPGAGSMVKRGSEVDLLLSRGPNQVPVPETRGQAVQAAQVTLAAAGLQLGETLSIYSEDQPGGLVAFQDPPAGSLVPPSTPVRLYLSIENLSQTYVMPDLIYRSYDDVRGFFEQRGFRLGSVRFEAYEGIPTGIVLRQFPLAGHPLRHEDPIALVVAAAAPEGGA